MHRLRAIFRWGTRHIDPERLWIQYGFALLLTLCLLTAVHFVSDAIGRHGNSAAETIDASGRLAVQSQQILLLAQNTPGLDGAGRGAMAQLTQDFETTYQVLLQGEIWSSQLQDHYYGGPIPLNLRIEEFAGLANQMAIRPAEESPAIVAGLQELHGPLGMFEALQTSASLFTAQSRSEALRLQYMLDTILLISGVALVVVALFIFLPAQLMVKSVIKELRNKTAVLCSSQKQLRDMNDQLNHLVSHDALTGLPNRAHMSEFMNSLMDTGKVRKYGVLFIGLDGFKAINDTIGHESGDLLLTSVAGRLQRCIDDDDLVARVGGDEFLLTTTEPPEDVAKRILTTFGDPFGINGRNITLTTSVGYLTTCFENRQPDQILGNAAIALHAAKAGGGRRAVAYCPRLGEDSALMRQLQIELRDAIRDGQIEPWFQPQVNLADGTLHGAEVLARWRHPTRGLLTPDRFLPAAERAGLIIELDHAIWQAAIRQAERWQADALWRPKISLNAAPDTIADPHLIEKLLKRIQEASLESDQVIIEVLETTLIESADDMAAINIDTLAECGISLELDDFGTGYASLSKLTQLPLAGIKLDRSLIAPLPGAGADSVVRAILALAAELGLSVVAEGIEEAEQAEHLNGRGCAIGQGYGFGRPMPPNEFTKWLGKHANEQLVAGRAA